MVDYTIHGKLLVGRYGPCWTERDSPPKYIVLHHTASGWDGKEKTGGCDAVWRYWWGLKPGSRVSSTDIVGKNGYIMRCVSPLDTAWHAGVPGWNEKSIGIEIVNRGDNRDPFPDAQMRSLAWLVHRYMTRFSIPKSRVIDHKSINKGKIDMRANFDWGKLWRYVDELKRKQPIPPAVCSHDPEFPTLAQRLRARLSIRKRRR